MVILSHTAAVDFAVNKVLGFCGSNFVLRFTLLCHSGFNVFLEIGTLTEYIIVYIYIYIYTI